VAVEAAAGDGVGGNGAGLRGKQGGPRVRAEEEGGFRPAKRPRRYMGRIARNGLLQSDASQDLSLSFLFFPNHDVFTVNYRLL
jgi:hypothetical protein